MIDTPAGKKVAHYVSGGSEPSTPGVVYLDLDLAADRASALGAFGGYLPTLGRLASRIDIQFQGYPAQKFVVEPDAGSRIEGIVFATPRRFYELLYPSRADHLAKVAAQQFFDSFQLAPGA